MIRNSSTACDGACLRLCGLQDTEALALVGAASFLETFAGILPGEDLLLHCKVRHSAEQYAPWLADPQYRLCMAEVGGAPVGYAVLCPPDLPVSLEPGDLELKRLYLLHRFQGSGLGRRLMDWAIAEARATGAPRLLLGVKADNEGAIGFYRRVGFAVVGERRFLVGKQWCDDLILALILS